MPQCTKRFVEPFTTTEDFINDCERLDVFVDGEICMGAVVLKMIEIGAVVIKMINMSTNVQHGCLYSQCVSRDS